MSRETSKGAGKRYGLARVCRAIASTQHSHSKNPVHIHAVTSPLFTAPDFV